jgi:hypothetical protein
MKARAFILVLALVAGAVLGTGCGTVTPGAISSEHASFDGNDQNSGVIGRDPLGRGYIITHRARDRYNALVKVFGRDFSPALRADAGVISAGDAYVIDREHLIKFIEMSRWAKAGFAPRN